MSLFWEIVSGFWCLLEMGMVVFISFVWRFCYRIVLLNYEWFWNEGFIKDYSLRRLVIENLRIVWIIFVLIL